jgi:hypothetical protein
MGLPEYHMPISGVSIYQIEMHANDGRYDLNAPYQRDTVWEVTRRRNLIRSLLMGIPTGTLILSDLPYREGSEHYFRVVDGKQRIEPARCPTTSPASPGTGIPCPSWATPTSRVLVAGYSDPAAAPEPPLCRNWQASPAQTGVPKGVRVRIPPGALQEQHTPTTELRE